MFDTGQASRILQLRSAGLAHLLFTYCKVNADKQYQLADWRVRPLPEEMVKYAREDTHYVLYIYDRLRQDLHQYGVKLNPSNQYAPFKKVWQNSVELAGKAYEKPIVKDLGYHMIIGRNKIMQSAT